MNLYGNNKVTDSTDQFGQTRSFTARQKILFHHSHALQVRCARITYVAPYRQSRIRKTTTGPQNHKANIPPGAKRTQVPAGDFSAVLVPGKYRYNTCGLAEPKSFRGLRGDFSSMSQLIPNQHHTVPFLGFTNHPPRQPIGTWQTTTVPWEHPPTKLPHLRIRGSRVYMHVR